ncbi:hypothetical protein HDZ31DRAFT_79826 [Schizophyllum fasciatum]
MPVYGVHISGVKDSAALEGEKIDAQKFHKDLASMKKADGSPLILSIRGGRIRKTVGLSENLQYCAIYECANEADQKEADARIQKEASSGKWGPQEKYKAAFEEANVMFEDGDW